MIEGYDSCDQNAGTFPFGSEYDQTGSAISRSGAARFPNPWCDIASEYVPRDLNTIFEWCTPAGTLVPVDAYGRTAPIETLKVGDVALTKYGDIEEIERASKRHISEDITVIKVAGISGLDLKITKSHKLWVWRPKSVTKPNLLPWKKAADELQYIEAGSVRADDWVAYPNTTYEETTKDWPYSMFICGLYVAEGCLIKYALSDGIMGCQGVQFTLGSHEVELRKRLITELEAYTGKTPSVLTPRDRDDIVQIRILDPFLAGWLHTNFGELSHNKSLPPALFHLPESMRLEFIGAWVDGDGSVVHQGDIVRRIDAYSCNQQLVLQCLRLSNSCGLAPSYRHKEQSEGGFTRANSWLDSLTFSIADANLLAPYCMKSRLIKQGDKGRKNSVRIEGDYVYRRVVKVSSDHFDGDVYNIRLTNEHSYVVNFCACSNCEYIYLTFGTYRSAAARVVRYFLTELVLEGESEQERDNYDDFLNNDLKIMGQLADIGDEYMVYGNVFVSVYFPFDRFLICPKCSTTYHSDTVAYTFDLKKGTFTGDCSKCGKTNIEFKREDRRSPDKTRIKLIRWNPKQIRLRVHPISKKIEYYLEIDPIFVQKLQEGNRFYLNDTPWAMIEACVNPADKSNRILFKFKDDAIYHLHGANLSGLPIKGWAIPPIMPNFKLAYYIQMLRRYDEAIALDFIVPFRILYPDMQQQIGADALSQMSMSNFIGHMKRMVENKRKYITDIQVAPFPVGYQMLGGEGKTLSPKDNIALALDELLNAIGYPAELYKGSLSIQAFPVALRLFEKTWGTMVEGFNDLIGWLLKKLNHNFMWGEVTGKLRSVTLADDIERKALALQAAAGSDISKSTAYRPLGIDYIEEQRRVVEEQETIQKLQQEAMDRSQAQQDPSAGGGGGGAAGGMPPPGGDPGATPGDVYEQGKALAQQLLLQTPPTMRRGELIKIKHSNPTLHAIVLQEMDNMRQEFARQGQAMMMDQAKMGSFDKEAADRIPSPMDLSLAISDQLFEYNRNDLRKIAMDVRRKVKGAKEAFHFVYSKILGWE